MKKLLIATMAAVSVGLCVKAEDTGFISGTSFETLPEGSYLATNGVSKLCKWYNPNGSKLEDAESGYKYWMTKATDAQIVVSNLSFFASNLTEDKRPEKWKSDSNSKALLIDTDGPLERWVCYSVDDVECQGMNIPERGLFFDSVVQFTATDVVAEPDSDDKLRVWLYSSSDDVSTETPGSFGETSPKTCLVVTAGKYDGDLFTSNLKAEHYEVQIDGVELQPDTWHRLTIKAIADINPTEYVTPGFEIWVDGKPVTYGAKTQFPSLKEAVTSGNETLQCVAFDGKGAVDDIVFTTTDPFYVPPVEAETYAIVATCDNASTSISFSSDEGGQEPLDDVSALDVKTTTVYGYVIPAEGYEVTSATFKGSALDIPTFDGIGYNFLLPIGTPKNGDEYAFVVTVTEKVSGDDEPEPEVPATPTIGGEGVKDADAFIAAANSGVVIKVPIEWTLVDNTLMDADGKEYATFADYYDVTLASDGTGTITLELNDKAKPEIDETAADKGDAIVVTETEVALGVTNAKAGLWYGAQAYSDVACAEDDKIGAVTGWVKATTTTVSVTAEKPEASAAFFKVVVDDQDHTTATPLAEQE